MSIVTLDGALTQASCGAIPDRLSGTEQFTATTASDLLLEEEKCTVLAGDGDVDLAVAVQVSGCELSTETDF